MESKYCCGFCLSDFDKFGRCPNINCYVYKGKNSKLTNNTWEDEDKDIQKKSANAKALQVFLLVIAVLAILWLMTGYAKASDIINESNISGYSLNQWCNAIYIAEGGKSTKHPYGILARYRHTTPLKACRNTVLHKWRDYHASGERKRFLAYLANAYCPIGGNMDNGTCKNWPINVGRILKHG